jgi:hypothetical protein
METGQLQRWAKQIGKESFFFHSKCGKGRVRRDTFELVWIDEDFLSD